MVKCDKLTGHNGSISKIVVDDNDVAITAGYDAALLVWNLNTRECLQGLFKGHKEPVVECQWRNSLCVSGDRKGGMAFWDINTGQAIKTSRPHEGAISKI